MPISISGSTLTFNDNSTLTTALFVGGSRLGGGIYIGVFSTWNLFASTFEYEENLQWKITGTSTPDTTSVTDGLANTNAMNNVDHPAAYYCATTMDGVGGFNDWYLPSKDELNFIYLNRHFLDNFTAHAYWSSTENTSLYSWSQDFADGNQYQNAKTISKYVRPVRRLALKLT